MNQPEYKIQSGFILVAQLLYPDLLMTISPAGFIMSAGSAMKMMRMGYRKGTPDVIILEPRGPWHGLLIEFKAPGGKVSPEQEEFLRMARERGYQTAICYTKAEALTILQDYVGSGTGVR